MKTSAGETPLFTRSFDLLDWLLRTTAHFPRHVRQSLTRRLLDAAFDLRERLEEANLRRSGKREERLRRADEALARLRAPARLAFRLGYLNEGQYRHAAEMEAEIGRLLGGRLRLCGPGRTAAG